MIRTSSLLWFICVLPAATIGAERESPIGQKIESFTLEDFRGQSHSLDDFGDQRFVVVAFLGTECPLAKLYGPRLAALHEKYRPRKVAFLAINSNVQDSITELAAYARIHNIPFPLLKDAGNRVADQFRATRTPEVFVLDASRKVRYWGRIDDQYGVGYIRDEPSSHDLARALDELLADKPVTQPVTTVVGCHIGRVQKPKADAEVTYSNQIARILQKRCVECHRTGDIAPFALTDYDEVVGWAEMIEEVVREQRMPPWHANPKHGKFANDRALSAEDKRLIYQWVTDGAPEGDSELPKPVEFVDGWQLPQPPDAVFTIQKEPFRVRAEGEVRYQWFSVDPKFTEDKWIKAAEILPGNRAVVHHILAFVREPGAGRKVRDGARGYLVGYVPGLRARPLPAGMAKVIPKGSTLVFQVHYTPIGSVQMDQSKIGFVFSDPDDITHRVYTTSAVNPRFAIPPHAANHRVEARSPTMPADGLLLSMSPHMHLRGKSFRYEAVTPDGERSVLLDVPHYDFNWQTSYRVAEPVPLPRGSRIHAVAHFDNSEENLSNPDPGKTVRWGDQTWDEMMIGYFEVAVPIEADNRVGDVLRGVRESNPSVLDRLRSLVRKLDKDGDGKVSREEAPERIRPVFKSMDADGDGHVTAEEAKAFQEKRRHKSSTTLQRDR